MTFPERVTDLPPLRGVPSGPLSEADREYLEARYGRAAVAARWQLTDESATMEEPPSAAEE